MKKFITIIGRLIALILLVLGFIKMIEGNYDSSNNSFLLVILLIIQEKK